MIRSLRTLGGVLAASLVTAAALAAAGSVTYTYDDAGRLKTTVYDNSANAQYTLDAAGNRTQVIQSLGNGALNFNPLPANYTVAENGSSITVVVTRSGASTGAVGVTYTTSNGTATAGSDYTTSTGTLTWVSGALGDRSFSVPILNNSVQESAETFAVTLSSPTGGALLGSSSVATITITDDDDGTPPEAPGTPSFSSITGTTVTATWGAATDNTGVTGYRYRLNGGAWNTLGNVLTVNLSGLSGLTNYAFEVQARDAAGNWGASASNSFTTLDGSAPTAPGTPSFSGITGTSATATWDAAGDNVGVTSYEYSLSGGGWVNVGNVLTVNLTGLTNGTTYSFAVRARDGANNTGAASSNSFNTLDTTAPGTPGAPTFTAIGPNGATASWVAASDNVGVTSYEYSLSGGAWVTVGNVLTSNLTGLTNGVTYTLSVRARDAANNAGLASSNPFNTLDNEAPGIPGTPTFSGVTGTTATATWAAAIDNVGVTSYEYSLSGGAWVSVGNVLTSNLTGLTNGVTYTLSVRARDAANNFGSASSNSFNTLDTTLPNAPGTPAFSSITGTSATATWAAATDNVGVTGYRYYLNGGEWQYPGNVVSVSLIGLTNGTGYTMYLQAGDAAGNWSGTVSGSFTTPDTSAPSAPGIPSFSSVTAMSATASWTAATDNVGVTGYQYRLNGGAWNTLGNVLTVNLSGLSAYTGYAFEIQARDAAGHWSLSGTSAFSTIAVPPSAPSLTATAASSSQINLSWTPSSGGSGYYSYYVYRNGGYVGGTIHPATTLPDSGLASYTTYNYVVYTYDTETMLTSAASNTANATTLDGTVPNAPGTPTFSSVTATSATASWTAATDNVGVTAYRYYLNSGAWQYPGNVLSVNLTGLTNGTGYSMYLQAGDAAGNWSGIASSSFSTPDTEAPGAPGVPSFSSIAGTTATASWGAAGDNVGVMAYRYRLNAGGWNTLGNVLTVGLSGLATSTAYTFEIQAGDAAGNWGASASNSFSTLAQPPSTPDWGAASLACTAWPYCIMNGSMTLTWAAGSGGGAPAHYEVYAWDGVSASQLVQSSAATSFVATTTGSWMAYYVYAWNAAGYSAGSTAYAWVTEDQPPGAPGALSFSSITSYSATVTWGAAADDVGVTAYRYYVNGGEWQYPGNVLSVSLSGLSQYTGYSVYVQAGDVSGQWSNVTASGSFTTAYGPPTAPSSLSATTASASQVNLSWGASSGGSSAYYYYVYRNGTYVGYSTHPTLSYSDTGLSPNTTYSYVVYAYDYYFDLWSAASNGASATTQLPSGDATLTVGFAQFGDPMELVEYYYGFSADPVLNLGAYSPRTLNGGRLVHNFYDYGYGPSYYWGYVTVSGFAADPGAGWLTSASANGLTQVGASASYFYTNGMAWWMFNSPFSLWQAASFPVNLQTQ